MFKSRLFLVFLILIITEGMVECDNVDGGSSSKTLSRSRRSSNGKANSEEFEKFFLKASKSVPRIGRRGYPNENYYNEDGTARQPQYHSMKYPYAVQVKRIANKNYEAPFWSEIAQIYEYNPDLPNVLEHLSNQDEEQSDDPSVYDYGKAKFKKEKFLNYRPQDKENLEYRLQSR